MTGRKRANVGLPRKPQRRTRGPRQRKMRPTAPIGVRERVLALDSSSRACGWSIFDDGQLVEYGRFNQSGDGHGERLMNFRQWLLSMMKGWEPTQVIYEAPYQGRMRNTFGILTRYAGQIEAAYFEHYGKELAKEEAVPAHLVKKAIGAQKGKNHEANKKIVVLLINRAFSLNLKFKANDKAKKISQDDEADAIALNWAWHRLYRPVCDEDEATERE